MVAGCEEPSEFRFGQEQGRGIRAAQMVTLDGQEWLDQQARPNLEEQGELVV
jgi:hypothetical protein